jgi:hypothetical protein
MELTIKNPSSRVLLEKFDNGVVLYEIGEDNAVISKFVYQTYYKDGMMDFDSVGNLLLDIVEMMKIPMEEPETNRRVVIGVAKIDPEKPVPGESEDTDND